MKNEETITDKEKNDLALIVGSQIRAARKNAGLSQEKLAKLADLHPTYIGQLERGEKNASLESIHKISSALRLPLEKLFEKLDQTGSAASERNIPLECYDHLLTRPISRQKIVVEFLSLLDHYSHS